MRCAPQTAFEEWSVAIPIAQEHSSNLQRNAKAGLSTIEVERWVGDGVEMK
jgi:hypothetical protein